MIGSKFMPANIPDFDKAWEYENGFHLTCDVPRLSKVLAQWELFKMASHIRGAIVECGVFKGASLARFAGFRELTGNLQTQKIIGFDSFGRYPDTAYEPDKAHRESFINEAGDQSISQHDLMTLLEQKKCGQNVELVAGDICQTVPQYLEQYPDLKISLLNLDVDIYEPSVTILEHFFPRIVKGGILILDDYGTFPGETQAADDYLAKNGLSANLEKLPYGMTAHYLVV